MITYAKKNRAKYWNFFQVDPPETYYGQMFPRFLEKIAATGVWKPTNEKVHIIREQNNYNMVIAEEVVKTLPITKFKLAKITDIQYPVQDWGPVMQAIKEVRCRHHHAGLLGGRRGSGVLPAVRGRPGEGRTGLHPVRPVAA